MGAWRLTQLAEARPDVIVLDLMMPEMDGFEFLDEIRQRDEWRDIPVLVVTAKDLTREDRERLDGCVERILQKSGRDEMLQASARALAAFVQRRDRRGVRREIGMKILYVEDNDDNVYVLQNRLERAGLRCDRRDATARRGLRWRAPSDPTRADGSEPAGTRRMGGDAHDQTSVADAAHTGDCAQRQRDGRRPREGACRRMRRL